MKQKILLVFIALSFLTVNSCDDDIIGPQPGSRNYEWTVDTIKIFSNYIHQIWGSAPDNIFGVGPGGALNTTIWHYDGKDWTTDNVSRNISPECVYGFSKNNVWIAGQNGKIWRYDGISWKENYAHTVTETANVFISDLYGTNNNDLYAVGTVWYNNETRRGIILHYDGIRWTQKFLANYNLYFYKIRKDVDGNCFVTCIKQDVKFNSRDTTVIYEYDDQGLREIYSDHDKNKKGAWAVIIGGKTYFSLEDGIYSYNKNNLKKIIENDMEYYAPLFRGRNEKDIFISNGDKILHYNGTDTKEILTLGPGAGIIDGLLFGHDVIFLDYNAYSGSLLYHGKLKE